MTQTTQRIGLAEWDAGTEQQRSAWLRAGVLLDAAGMAALAERMERARRAEDARLARIRRCPFSD